MGWGRPVRRPSVDSLRGNRMASAVLPRSAMMVNSSTRRTRDYRFFPTWRLPALIVRERAVERRPQVARLSRSRMGEEGVMGDGQDHQDDRDETTRQSRRPAVADEPATCRRRRWSLDHRAVADADTTDPERADVLRARDESPRRPTPSRSPRTDLQDASVEAAETCGREPSSRGVRRPPRREPARVARATSRRRT